MNKTVLILAAHPDDEVLGCGGTIARFASEGANVHTVYFTDGVSARQGSAASAESGIESQARRVASKTAADILNVKSTVFGEFPDNCMDQVHFLDIVQFVEHQVNHYMPDMILTHHAGDLNIDHRLVHQATMTACRPQPGHSVKTILFFEVPSSTEWQTPASAAAFAPNWFVDITRYLDIREQALQAYADEMRPWPHSRSFKAVEHLVRWRGASVGVEAAEAFMLGRNILK